MEKQIIEINFFCDESGMLHSNSSTRFFVIGGYFCLKEKSKAIKLKYARTLKRIKIKREMSKSDELKTRDMSIEEKIKLITALQESEGFNGFAIVVDKSKLKKRIEKESIFYNYLIKIIIGDILVNKCNTSFPNDDIKVDMLLDSRNVSVGHMKSLEDYLNSEYLFTRFEFKADYQDSKLDSRIQATDLIANTIYELFKEPLVIKDVIPILNLDKIIVTGFPEKIRYIKTPHTSEVQ